jgi:hypothetical protein
MDAGEHERWWADRGARELRELLFYEWDPIGLSKLADAPLDEYEHYAGTIARRLRAGTSDEELAAVLDGFRSEMGLEPGAELPVDLARRLREWYSRSLAEWRSA